MGLIEDMMRATGRLPGPNRTGASVHVTQKPIAAQWVDTQVFCGDNAALQVDVTPAPAAAATVTVEILHPSTGATLTTLTGPLTATGTRLVWIAKAATANWRTDKIGFRATVSAGGTAMSSNQLTFKPRPTTGWIAKNVRHESDHGYAPNHEKHDASLEAAQVHYSLKYRTYGDPFDATKQAAAKAGIEGAWNGSFSGKKFHRKSCKRGNTCDCAFDCCKVGYHLDVNFVPSGENVAIKIHATVDPAERYQSGTNGDGGDWGDPPMNGNLTYPHETGHVLGQYDEYAGGATDPSGVQPADATTPNLMKCSNLVLLNRHYRWALKFLNDNAGGDTYETIPPGE